jgi:periplasmic copper chaperone A
MKTRIPRVAVLLAAVLLPACGWGEGSGGEGLAVEGAWARPMTVVEGGPSPSGVHSAVYLTLRNGGGPDRLLGGETDVAEVLEIHESRMEDGIMRMRPVEGGIRIPAGSVAELRPGGLHLMLLDLRASLVEGDTLVLSLQFEESGTREVRVPVRPVGER